MNRIIAYRRRFEAAPSEFLAACIAQRPAWTNDAQIEVMRRVLAERVAAA